MNKGVKILVAVLVAVAIAAGSFSGGVYAATRLRSGSVSAALPGLSNPSSGLGATSGADSASTLVDQVDGLIQREALVPPTETSITANAIDGVLKSLGDPYATYFDPQHYKLFSEQTQGSFGGIGITLGENKLGQAYVAGVIKGTPADKAGMKKGDVFVSVDGIVRDKWSSDEVVKRVRGKEGTKVTIGVKRVGSSAVITFTMARAAIAMPNIESQMIGRRVGYIRLFSFNAKAGDDIRKALSTLSAKGAKGFILDLRDNPGGLLSSGVDVVSLFVKQGPVVRVDERGKAEQVYAVSGDVATNKPLVVLVNENSASASEIAAGALQDYGRATIVGVKTFGKGSVQTIERLTNGGAVKFTTAHYLTPKKRVINHKGLVPDVIVPMAAAKQASAKTDVQRAEAVTVLQGKL